MPRKGFKSITIREPVYDLLYKEYSKQQPKVMGFATWICMIMLKECNLEPPE